MISGLPWNLTALQSRRFASLSSLLPWYSLHGATTSNTDNKEKKLVMFFAGASLLSIKHTVRGYYRDCAAALNNNCVRGVFTCSQLPLYRDTRKTQNIPGLAKNLPYPPSPASETLYQDWEILPSGRDASGNAFFLYCRTVMVHSGQL